MNQVFNLQGAEVNVFCSWGEGPDVGLNIVRSDDSLKTWPPKFLPIDMTAEEAIQIGVVAYAMCK